MTDSPATLAGLRDAIRAYSHADEPRCVGELLEASDSGIGNRCREAAVLRARELVRRCRAAGHRAGSLDAFLQEFGLSNREGVALMCLAEALLRVPDDATADALIAEKIRAGDWDAHLGKSASPFVNASVWGLMLTGRLVTMDPEAQNDTVDWVRRLVARLGEPVVRRAVLQAMRILGGQYVLGRSIDEAMRRGRALEEPGTRFSFDMLGEGARTFADAARYREAYSHAIDAIGNLQSGDDPIANDGISVKLSALHPRFEYAQRQRLATELLPSVVKLARQARRHRLGFSIDAEEAARLEPALDLFEVLARAPELSGWDGLGFVLQAYQKRAPRVADWLIALARATGRRLMVRLVKGAYWHTEIKHAQEQGLTDYPVFTRKSHTDLCYEVCAARLLSAPDAIFPQFASHNAQTVSLVLELARSAPSGAAAPAAVTGGGREQPRESPGGGPGPERSGFEFQRLHGMGQLLYAELNRDAGLPLRVYAPVGSHRDLLPYLVRRLLENGANSSFVNRFLDAKAPIEELISDTREAVRGHGRLRHPDIPPPPDLYRLAGEARANAGGIDLDDPDELTRLMASAGDAARLGYRAGPIVDGAPGTGEAAPVQSPSNRATVVGTVVEADRGNIDAALDSAWAEQEHWDACGGDGRAEILERSADLLEANRERLIGLIGAEAGRTLEDALSEVREAVDFCRYYAMQARQRFETAMPLPGPTGERNELSLHGRGVFACISPWNFPLAIFTGQVAAALAAGNAVAAKPAEQTPLVAAEAVRLMHQAGVPGRVLHLLPGDGARVGGPLIRDPRIAGVAFTGSMETAALINRQLAGRDGPIVPLIAETGGQNVMLVDSTALPEQVVDDVIDSAFRSAGQRCSALRVLYLQEEIADDVIAMLAGAMRTLTIGDPLDPATDIGPVIDEDARAMLQAHVDNLRQNARVVAECKLPRACEAGSFFPPTVIEIESIRRLEGEVFGPVLHVARFAAERLDNVLAEIEATGFGLTLGIHSRIDGFAREVFEKTRTGNVYVNRNMIGAVVGVHPFGGRGLSGTGPKAGGPHYLLRFATERTRSENITAKGGNTELFGLRQ